MKHLIGLLGNSHTGRLSKPAQMRANQPEGDAVLKLRTLTLNSPTQFSASEASGKARPDSSGSSPIGHRSVLPRVLVRTGMAALALSAAQLSFAAPVYNNGLPDQISGTQMSEFVVAEDFSLTASATISSIRFWSIQDAPADYLGSVYWAVYSNVGGAPGAVLFGDTAVTTTASLTGNSTGFGYAEYVFDVDVADFAIGAGTYWLGLHNGPLASTVASEMLWSTTASTIGSESVYFDSTSGWVGAGTHLAFALDGTGVVVPPPPPPPGVPEPATLALVGLAVLAARVARRKA